MNELSALQKHISIFNWPASRRLPELPRHYRNIQIKVKQQRDSVGYSTYKEFQTEFASVGELNCLGFELSRDGQVLVSQRGTKHAAL